MDEFVNYDEVMEPEVLTNEGGKTGLSTGAVVAIGIGLAVATTAVVKLAKKAWAKHKAKKALRTPAEGETVEPTEDEIATVTK